MEVTEWSGIDEAISVKLSAKRTDELYCVVVYTQFGNNEFVYVY